MKDSQGKYWNEKMQIPRKKSSESEKSESATWRIDPLQGAMEINPSYPDWQQPGQLSLITCLAG